MNIAPVTFQVGVHAGKWAFHELVLGDWDDRISNEQLQGISAESERKSVDRSERRAASSIFTPNGLESQSVFEVARFSSLLELAVFGGRLRDCYAFN